jgi:hypothetical protein
MATVWYERGMRMLQQWRRPIAGVVAVLVLAGGLFVWMQFFRRVPPPTFASDEEQFLFGSIGTERDDGIPFWIWLVLPRVFPEHLPAPGGYAALGILSEPGREMPIGFSKATIGYDRVGINCAGCHTGSTRRRPGDPATIVPGAPPQSGPMEAYLKFLIACASDPRFNARTLMGEIAKNYELSAGERLAFRFAIIPATRRAILRLQDRSVLIDHATLRQHADDASVKRAETYLHH